MIRESKSTVAIILLLTLIQNPGMSAQTGSIKGQVKEQNGKALEGVKVRATSARNKDQRYEAASNKDGRFELTGLPPGDYSLSFEKRGYKSFSTRKMEVTPNESVKLSHAIELVREGPAYSVIRGAVFYGTGYTLPNATVTIERIDSGKKFKDETISQEGGEFAFRLKAERAKYRVTARARDLQPASIEIEIEGDELRNIALTLQPIQ